VREEFLDCEVVREGVDIEGEAQVGFGGVEDGAASHNARVVDEDGWVADCEADGLCGEREGFAGGDVAFEVVDRGALVWSELGWRK
jgi:hypothetical protein